MPKTFDVVVLGATAAGYVAAIQLADRGRRVVVVDAPASRTESTLADWLPADALAACRPLKAVRSAALDEPFRAVCFHSHRFDRQAEYRARSILGYRLSTRRLLRALDRLAGKSGVERVRLKEPPKLTLEESGVVLSGRRAVRGGLLLIAQGSPEEAASDLALPLRPAHGGGMTLCGMDVPLPGARTGAGRDADLHVVAFPGGTSLGVFFAAGDVLHVRIIFPHAHGPAASDSSGPGPRADFGEHSRAQDLGRFLLCLQQAGLLPEKLPLSRASAAIWHPPGGMALELESLLAKRTLLIGTAGGFASALTGQTLDPSARSALVAAEVADRALKGPRLQEVLGEFKVQWRQALADRIRPPGTSLQMLLPLVLSNRAITAKFARTFLYGEAL